MRGVAGGNTRPRWATTDNELVERLREQARREAEFDRLHTDLKYGPTYESIKPENTLSWQAAAALEAADTIQTRGGDGLREALTNAMYALEYWEREARINGGRANWLKDPYVRGVEEITRARTALTAPPQSVSGMRDEEEPAA